MSWPLNCSSTCAASHRAALRQSNPRLPRLLELELAAEGHELDQWGCDPGLGLDDAGLERVELERQAQQPAWRRVDGERVELELVELE